MTAQIKQIVTAEQNRLEVAQQDYELAKKNVRDVLRSGYAWEPGHQARFRAAIERQAEARDRFLRVMMA